MKTLESLKEEKKVLEAKLKALSREIMTHPDEVMGFFTLQLEGYSKEDQERVKSFVSNILFVENIEGWTDSRKNPVEWRGFAYAFRDNPEEEFWCREGSNWCSDFFDCGKRGYERAPDIEHPSNIWHDLWDEVTCEGIDKENIQNETSKRFIDELLSKPRHITAGYLLWSEEGL